MPRTLFLLLACLFLGFGALRADPVDLFPPADNPSGWLWQGHWQSTSVTQAHGGFPATVSGLNSLRDQTEVDSSFTSTLFLGARVLPGLEVYADPEATLGAGFSSTLGIAGFPNGEVYRVSQPGLVLDLARLYARWTLGLGGPQEDVPDGENQLPGRVDVSRVSVAVGKFALTDFFDANTYSQDPRTQFLNWSIMDFGAWDYAADTYGYTQGAYLEWDGPIWTARFAEVLMPTQANGPVLSDDIVHDRSENAEADLNWGSAGSAGALRLLGYWNHADMGNYRQTLDTPSDGMAVGASATQGAEKYGFGVNLEQALGTEAGMFLRVSYSPGNEESFVYTAIDRSVSLGGVLDGGLWGRAEDRIGVAAAVNGLNPAHAEYLAAGGYDFIIGDGSLDYGLEGILEAYYDIALWGGLSLTPDFQYIVDPGYDRLRGPVAVYGLRLHYEI